MMLLWLTLLAYSLAVHGADWDTVYNFANETVYVRPRGSDTVLRIQFDDTLSSNSKISSTIASPADGAKLVSNINYKDGLVAVYPDDTYSLHLQYYNNTLDSWHEVELVDQAVEFYANATYMTTLDDESKIYIYGGASLYNDTDITNRLISVNLETGKIQQLETTVTPANFYGAASVPLDSQTNLVVGGKSSGGWVGLTQLAFWEYQTWGFREVDNSDSSETINSRINPLLLPVLETDGSNTNGSEFVATSVLMIGGDLSSGASSPQFASLNLTGDWTWTSMDTVVSVANSLHNNDSSLELDTILGAAAIYNTLIVVTDSSSTKRTDEEQFGVVLYDTTTLQTVETMDYKSVQDSNGHTKGNSKTLVIVLAVIIPLLALILIAILVLYLYKRHKHIQAEREKEQELKNALEYYNYIAEKHSIVSTDSNSHSEEEVKVNNYDDDDNLSIGSWRRKREEHERKNKVFGFNIPLPPTPRTESADEEPQGFLRRSLSSVSGKLGRSFSFQSSVRSGTTDVTDVSAQRRTVSQPRFPPPSPAHVGSPQHSSSTLYLIPEVSSTKESMMSNATVYEDANENFVKGHETQKSEDFDDPSYDVQILVSSKRKSKLRVVNPDPEEEQDLQSTRRRKVSNESHDE